MVEFVLSFGTQEAATYFADADPFVQGCITGMFFCEQENLENPTLDQLSDAFWTKITNDCRLFQRSAAKLLAQAYADPHNSRDSYCAEQAGRDFWYTRNHHGTGFWDRNLGIVGDGLTEEAHKFQELCPYVGDDGKIYF